jgi:hypothetical protein
MPFFVLPLLLPFANWELIFLQVHNFVDNNDALLLLVIPATSCRDVAVSRALKLARDLDPDGKLEILDKY